MKIDSFSELHNKTIEQIIDYLVNEKLKASDLMNKLVVSNKGSKENDKLIQKISFAENRINEPLELSLKVFYILAPFGVINIFSEDDTNFNRFLKYRCIRKINSFYVCSSIGALFYTVGAVLIGFIYNKI